MRVSAMLVGILALPLFVEASGTAGQRPKAAWEWTMEERLARRFAPERAWGRIARESAGRESQDGKPVLKGDQTPELFLPIELFASLMTGVEGDASVRTAYRSILRERIIAFGFDDEEFWQGLEQAITSHVGLARRHGALVKNLSPDGDGVARDEVISDIESVNRELCASRVVALTKARQHFGGNDFDRFLYTAVAPGLTIAPVAAGSATPEHLRFLAGGCR